MEQREKGWSGTINYKRQVFRRYRPNDTSLLFGSKSNVKQFWGIFKNRATEKKSICRLKNNHYKHKFLGGIVHIIHIHMSYMLSCNAKRSVFSDVEFVY